MTTPWSNGPIEGQINQLKSDQAADTEGAEDPISVQRDSREIRAAPPTGIKWRNMALLFRLGSRFRVCSGVEEFQTCTKRRARHSVSFSIAATPT